MTHRLPVWVKILWTAWLLVWAPVYWRTYGAQNFLYFCDAGNILIAIALWTESALLFTWQAVGLLVFQTLYAVDLLGAWLSGRHLIGGTEFMFEQKIPLLVRLLSLFHIVTPPLLLWAVKKLGYDPRGWKVQTLMTWILVPINYFWRPEYNVNWARGPGHEQHVLPGVVYLIGYLIVAPAVVYYPTHRVLQWWSKQTAHGAAVQ